MWIQSAVLACLAAVPSVQGRGTNADHDQAQGLALLASKVLTGAEQGPAVLNHAVVLVRNGLIESVGELGSLTIPDGYEVRDLGDLWLMPGMIDLHCHVAGMSLFEVNDLNDGVYLANPGLRASAAVVPGKDTLLRGLAGGVTSVLYIPGSATNIGGQGVLLKTGLHDYEAMEIRNPGSMKLAQAGNPERWTIGPGRSFMNWNTRNTIQRGMRHARIKAEQASERPNESSFRWMDPQWDVFDSLLSEEIRISAHTQMFQVVLATITIVKRDLGVGVFIDHGTIGGWRAGGLAEEYQVPAIVGPRSIDTTSAGFQRITAATEPGIRGVAAGYQRMGHKTIGFNTDSPVVPQEELSVQATMAARYGFRDDNLDVVRGLTLAPAKAALIDDIVGSLEVGKHADILVLTGHPADPRTSIQDVYIEGQLVYSGLEGERLW